MEVQHNIMTMTWKREKRFTSKSVLNCLKKMALSLAKVVSSTSYAGSLLAISTTGIPKSITEIGGHLFQRNWLKWLQLFSKSVDFQGKS